MKLVTLKENKTLTKRVHQKFWMRQANQQSILTNHTLVQLTNQWAATQFI